MGELLRQDQNKRDCRVRANDPCRASKTAEDSTLLLKMFLERLFVPLGCKNPIPGVINQSQIGMNFFSIWLYQ
jgi:hypothetical protein